MHLVTILTAIIIIALDLLSWSPCHMMEIDPDVTITDTIEFAMSRNDVLNFTIHELSNGSIIMNVVIELENAQDIAAFNGDSPFFPFLWLSTDPDECDLLPAGPGEITGILLAGLDETSENVTIRIDHLLTAQDVTFDDIEEGCLFITYFVTTTRYKQEETDVNNSVMDTFAVIDSLRSKVTTNNGNVRKPKLMEIPMPVTMTITLDIPNLFVFSSGIRIPPQTTPIAPGPSTNNNNNNNNNNNFNLGTLNNVITRPSSSSGSNGTPSSSILPKVPLPAISFTILNAISSILVLLYFITLLFSFLDSTLSRRLSDQTFSPAISDLTEKIQSALNKFNVEKVSSFNERNWEYYY